MNEVLEFLNNNIKEKDTIVCATSGGVDSMCLLFILNKYNINIICAHVNHNLREESYEEYEFVKDYCLKNNIIFEGLTFDKINSGNLESKFREKRYKFFDDIIKKYNAKYLFTAHHGDDLIETILMRIVRGSSINGYAGFDIISKRDNYSILRPLVFTTKDELYKYAKDNNIEYREDKTNTSDNYTRNRYRKYILPKLKEENKNVHKKFLKFSNELSNSYNFINNYVSSIIDKYYINNKLNIKDIKNMDEFIIKKIIYNVLYNTYKNNINLINDNTINEVYKVIISNRPNLKVDLPLNNELIKSYDYIYIKDINIKNDFKIELKDEVHIELGTIKKIDKTKLTNNYVCHLNSKDVKLPLYVRNRKEGDYIEILGLNGKKKIKDLFINEKVPKHIRDKYPIVVDSNDNIVWLPGLKKSKYDSLKFKNYDIILWYMKEEEDE